MMTFHRVLLQWPRSCKLNGLNYSVYDGDDVLVYYWDGYMLYQLHFVPLHPKLLSVLYLLLAADFPSVDCNSIKGKASSRLVEYS